tara:strand:- start:311 stop:607 length:297 start_codon:yes stop_codon:yes gene_type:complete
MAQFCITIADEDVERVIGAMCVNYGYSPRVDNPDFDPDPERENDPENPKQIDNPESSFQFANRMTRDFLMNNTVAYETRLAKESVPQPSPPVISDPQE